MKNEERSDHAAIWEILAAISEGDKKALEEIGPYVPTMCVFDLQCLLRACVLGALAHGASWDQSGAPIHQAAKKALDEKQ